jgi:hypothetical protein
VVAVLLAIVLALATNPHDCHVIAAPLFGADVDSPAGVGIDGARITTKCIF